MNECLRISENGAAKQGLGGKAEMGFSADLQDCALEHYPCTLVANDGRPLCIDLQHAVGPVASCGRSEAKRGIQPEYEVIVLDH